VTDLDLFACAGGATTGIAMLGRHVVGVDHDPDACATHATAGHPTIRADLTQPAPVSFTPELLWASPPCTAFSMAGKGEGREVADVLVGRILAENWEPLDGYDPPVWLVLPTMREVLRLNPVAVAMENVPPTLPVMHACAIVLQRHGYSTAVGVLSAETFGVAQTRKRAFLIANRTRSVSLPEPTHQAYGSEVDEAQGSLFGEPLLPWVSMAEALRWQAPAVVRTRCERTTPGGNDFGSDKPSWALTEKARSWERLPVALDRRCQQGPKDAREPVPAVEVERPAPSMTVSGLALGQFQWTTQRPSTTLVSSFRPDVVAGPGYRQAGDGPRQDAPGSISISISEAARLQAFPNGHPWRGSRTSIFRQVGNAVPPPVAAAVAGAALGVDWRPAVAAYLTELYSRPLEREAAA
jgi:DNA (cytosine-5)-methyltransferase 1